jgi:hypothetical protein
MMETHNLVQFTVMDDDHPLLDLSGGNHGNAFLQKLSVF